MARERGLDLIEIAPNTKPPVCRIMSYGKYQYQKSKQERTQNKKQKQTETKSVRISLKIGTHDMEIRARQAEKFLGQGHRVKIDIILRGREKALFDLSRKKLHQFIDLLGYEVKIEQVPQRQPRGLSMIISSENPEPYKVRGKNHENKKSINETATSYQKK